MLITTFLHAFAFFAGEAFRTHRLAKSEVHGSSTATFYLPVYYQSLGASVTRAGIE